MPEITPTATPATGTAAPPAKPEGHKLVYGEISKDAKNAIFDKLDASEAAPVIEKPAETPAKPAEEKAAAGTEGEKPKVDEKPTSKVRQALNSIEDPEVRKTLEDRYFRVKRWEREYSMPATDIDKYLAAAIGIAPSVDLLDQVHRTASVAQVLANRFSEGTPQGYARFTESWAKFNPDAFTGYVDYLINNIDGLAKGLESEYTGELGQKLKERILKSRDRSGHRNVRNLVLHLEAAAKASAEGKGPAEDAILGDVAEELKKFLARFGIDLGAVDREEIQDGKDLEIARLKKEREELAENEVKAFRNSAFNMAGTALQTMITKWIESKAPALSPKTKLSLVRHVGEGGETAEGVPLKGLYEVLLTNPHLNQRLFQMERQGGSLDMAAARRIATEYVRAGERLLPTVATPFLREEKERSAPVQAQRTAKIEQHMKRKDVGVAGAPTPARPAQLPKAGPGKTLKEQTQGIFDALDAAAEAHE